MQVFVTALVTGRRTELRLYKATRRYRGREQSSSLHLLSRGEKSMAAPTRVVCRASVDLTSQPPGTAAGCGSSLAWWNRLTTTLSGAPGLA